jgi:hypothetical protein
MGEEYDEETDAPKKMSDEDFDNLDRKQLANKFFELNT